MLNIKKNITRVCVNIQIQVLLDWMEMAVKTDQTGVSFSANLQTPTSTGISILNSPLLSQSIYHCFFVFVFRNVEKSCSQRKKTLL